MTIKLCPVQQHAFDTLKAIRSCGSVFTLEGRGGDGATVVARELAREFNAAWIDAAELFESTRRNHPLAIEHDWLEAIRSRMREQRAVVVDDFAHGSFLLAGCGGKYPRAGYLEAGLEGLCNEATQLGAWVLFVGASRSDVLREKGIRIGIPKFTMRDQEFLFRAVFSPEASAGLDYEQIHRFAPKLSARQIARTALFLDQVGLTTEQLIEYLRSQHLTTNVDLAQVEDVRLEDLHGVDDVIQRLEANIVLPLENDELAKRFQLTPRRGVLLYGPPGTGKTTIGRALAQRLKSKFFLIDGTFISGTHDFYQAVVRVFEHAKRNAPAVVFIDDSDVIFENGDGTGFYRYLLTILDGIESEEAGRITVLFTAMDLANLPPAMIRSGRIELWLEMKLPDEAARLRILEQRLTRSMPAEQPEVDMPELVRATEGFTGADLRRLVEDGKNLWAWSIANHQSGLPAQHFLAAAADIARNKELIRAAGETASAHKAGRRSPPQVIYSMVPVGGE
jgi:ATP-dependent 26S proteasome regulatory subunit